MHQSAAGQSVAAVALLEKHAKTRLAVAADHFNRDYKKGFQFLQVRQATTCTATTGRSNWLLAVGSLLMKLPWLSPGGSWQLAAGATMRMRKPAAKQIFTLWPIWRVTPGSTNSFHPDICQTRDCLQTLGLLGETLEHDQVARFLRHCPGLSKQTIGDLLGENDQFFLDVLDAFTGTFSFRGAHPCSMMVFLASMQLTHGACKRSPFLACTVLHFRVRPKTKHCFHEVRGLTQGFKCASVQESAQKSAAWT